MKFGYRTPSLSKSIKARTTGHAKRAVKRAVVPGYGRKGVGYIKNPKKAVYNKVYHKTTVSMWPKKRQGQIIVKGNNKVEMAYSQKSINKAFFLCLFLGFIGAHQYYLGNKGKGFRYTITFGYFLIGWFLDLIGLFFRFVFRIKF